MGPAFGEVPGALAWIGTAIGVVGYFSVTLADALVIEAIRTLSAAEVVADTNAYIVLATGGPFVFSAKSDGSHLPGSQGSARVRPSRHPQVLVRILFSVGLLIGR
jgi:hypothetical protein